MKYNDDLQILHEPKNTAFIIVICIISYHYHIIIYIIKQHSLWGNNLFDTIRSLAIFPCSIFLLYIIKLFLYLMIIS